MLSIPWRRRLNIHIIRPDLLSRAGLPPTVRLHTIVTMTSSNPPSGTSTPRFTSQSATAEDLLKSHTVGLVNLADFRKRRADVLELKEKEAREGTNTPDSDG